jgi:NAD-dependent DNA ligase
MAGERITRILKAKSGLSDEEVTQMSDREAWKWLYTRFPSKTKRYKKNLVEICFTGFSTSERAVLEEEAQEAHLNVVKSVTKQLQYLVAGSNAGPTKLQKAREQEVVILTAYQFRAMLETGELPTDNVA